jgi:hypothetical protein
MMNNGNCNINNVDDNNTSYPLPPNHRTRHGNTRETLSIHGANTTDHSTDVVHKRKNPIEKEEE